MNDQPLSSPANSPPGEPETLPPRAPSSAGAASLGGLTEFGLSHSVSWPTGLPPSLPAMLGRYELRKQLGQGGMGAVYLAHDTQLDRFVALKIPTFSVNDSPDLKERFFREARAAATLSHPNICPVHDVGQIDGVHYLTMGFLEGQPLNDVIAATGPMPERQAALLARQVAVALQEAHAKGIIHRDLKPGNIMINQRKQPVIMDFGLARRTANKDEIRLTQDKMMLGTPAYMSPEQARGDVAGQGIGCDIYSLGVILYEMLTARLPFEGEALAVVVQIAVDPPTPPSKHRPNLDPGLEAICLKALAKKPAERYESMKAFAAALDQFLRGKSAATAVEPATPSLELAGPTLSPPAPTGDATDVKKRKKKGKRKRRGMPVWAWILGVGVAAIAASVVGYVATDYGAVEIQLSDPNAQVEIRIDGQVIAAPHGESAAVRLKAGAHHLEVVGKDYQPYTDTVHVMRGETELAHVKLTALKKPPLLADSKPPLPTPPDLKPPIPPPSDVKPVVNPPPPPQPAFTWPTEDLRLGRIPAPDLSKIKPLLEEDFSDPKRKSGFAQGKTDKGEHGIENGKYVIKFPGLTALGGTPIKDVSNFGCLLVGRWRGVVPGAWGLAIGGAPREAETKPQHGIEVLVGSDGKLSVGPGPAEPEKERGPKVGPLSHMAIKAGEEFNSLLVIVRGRMVEIYVNGIAVCDPILVDRDFTPAHLQLTAVARRRGDHVAEFQRMTVWPTEGLPNLEFRRTELLATFRPLFNGKDLTGWRSPVEKAIKPWTIEQGALTAGPGAVAVFTERGDFTNFHLRCEVKISESTSGGLYFRATHDQMPTGCYSAHFHHFPKDREPQKAPPSGSLLIIRTGGSEPKNTKPATIVPDAWFPLEVIANGDHIIIKINNQVTADYVDENKTFMKGHIGLHRQAGTGTLHFRKIELKELPAASGK